MPIHRLGQAFSSCYGVSCDQGMRKRGYGPADGPTAEVCAEYVAAMERGEA